MTEAISNLAMKGLARRGLGRRTSHSLMRGVGARKVTVGARKDGHEREMGGENSRFSSGTLRTPFRKRRYRPFLG